MIDQFGAGAPQMGGSRSNQLNGVSTAQGRGCVGGDTGGIQLGEDSAQHRAVGVWGGTQGGVSWGKIMDG
jgi:hypothetical protein